MSVVLRPCARAARSNHPPAPLCAGAVCGLVCGGGSVGSATRVARGAASCAAPLHRPTTHQSRPTTNDPARHPSSGYSCHSSCLSHEAVGTPREGYPAGRCVDTAPVTNRNPLPTHETRAVVAGSVGSHLPWRSTGLMISSAAVAWPLPLWFRCRWEVVGRWESSSAVGSCSRARTSAVSGPVSRSCLAGCPASHHPS